MKASERNSAFDLLVFQTRSTDFGKRLLELQAFALGAACVLKFDSKDFELWSSNSFSARMLHRSKI